MLMWATPTPTPSGPLLNPDSSTTPTTLSPYHPITLSLPLPPISQITTPAPLLYHPLPLSPLPPLAPLSQITTPSLLYYPLPLSPTPPLPPITLSLPLPPLPLSSITPPIPPYPRSQPPLSSTTPSLYHLTPLPLLYHPYPPSTTPLSSTTPSLYHLHHPYPPLLFPLPEGAWGWGIPPAPSQAFFFFRKKKGEGALSA